MMGWRLFAIDVIILLIIFGSITRNIFSENVVPLREGSGSVLLACTNGEISVEDVTIKDDGCDPSNFCEEQLLPVIKSSCDSYSNCTLDTDLLAHCGRPPIYVHINYSCWRFNWVWSRSKKGKKELCSNSLDTIWCSDPNIVYIDDVSLVDGYRCTKNDILTTLRLLCNRRRVCRTETRYCLFDNKYADIHFVCKDRHTTDASYSNRTTPSTVKTSSTIPITVIPDSSSSTETNNLTQATSAQPYITDYQYSTEISQGIPTFKIKDDRVLLISNGGQVINTLCDTGWGVEEVTVLCRYLKTSTGLVLFPNAFQNITSYPVDLRCLGHETSFFDCDVIMENVTCSSDQVAGAKCCEEEEDCKDQDVTKKLLQKDEINKGAIAGSVLAGVIVVVAIFVSVCLLRKRLSNKLDQKRTIFIENSQQRDDYIGSQDINLPNTNQHAPKTFIYSVANGTCRGDTAIESGSDGYFVLEKENPSIDASSGNRDYEYATSSNIAYDNSNELRQQLSKENVYSHATDGVYDLTANTKRKPSEEAVYSHSVDGIYDKTFDTKHVNNDDNVYSHSVDDFYDKLRQKETSDADDTYNHTFGATTKDDYNITQ